MINPIIRLSAKVVVTAIPARCTAKMFSNVKVGDELLFEMDVETPGRNRSVYASYFTVTNLKDGSITRKSHSELVFILNRFKYSLI